MADNQGRKMSAAIAGPVSFGQIPKEDWYQPNWIDEEKAAASRAQMVADNVVYGGEVLITHLVLVSLIPSAAIISGSVS